MRRYVSKFGGTSLADAEQFKKVIKIVQDNPRRRYVVVSAPGKRNADDRKVTDLLYGLVDGIDGLSQEDIYAIIEHRFSSIIQKLGLQLDFGKDFLELRFGVMRKDRDFVASRGEYLNAKILAAALGYTFVDAAEIVCFDDKGQLDIEATLTSKSKLMVPAMGYVIPGFYGSMPDGSIKVLSRGGSDLTGALVAAIIEADVYENWTDVSGMRMADPRIVIHAQRIDVVTYEELQALIYSGATVLHEEVLLPLQKLGIPIQLRNTNRPSEAGTWVVVGDKMPKRKVRSIVGIAGRKDFTSFTIKKPLLNKKIGFMTRVCRVFEDNGISILHTPGGVDTSIVVKSESLDGKVDSIEKALWESCCPDNIIRDPDLALVCTVGAPMQNRPGVVARMFTAVAQENVNIRMIDQGSSESSVMIAVKNGDYNKTINAIYHAFV